MKKESKVVSLKSMKWKLWLLGTFKIPMVGFIRPRLLELNNDSAKIKIRLKRRTKNHLGSMYFGSLAVGADLAAGLHAFYYASQSTKRMSFAFKGVKAEFLMRAESHVTFVSNQGDLIKKTVESALSSGERVNQEIEVLAVDESGNEVAKFQMMVSIKFK
ncbi:MAG: acyl-coenzyme A thioesterase PaaI-like protein [Crocinitomicaceae bacterium]|jgi:acyl-coenzyme A thioesterase PaaI-like protein